MDSYKVLAQVRRNCGEVEVRRLWLEENSAVVECLDGAGETRLVLVDEGVTRIFSAPKTVHLVAVGLGGAALSALAILCTAAGVMSSGKAIGAGAVAALALGAFAVGSLAVGALAVGAVALGKVAVGKLHVQEARLQRVVIDELVINSPVGQPIRRDSASQRSDS